MNNLFSVGLLTISIIALNGCKESVDLSSNTYRTSQSASAASNSNDATDQSATGVIISTTAPVTVVKVVKVDENEATQSNTTGSDSDNTETDNTETVEDSGQEPTTTQPTETNEVTETVAVNTASCEAEATDINPFVRVQLHYGLMYDTPFINDEVGGLDSIKITEDAPQNSTILKLESTIGLKSGQLITYLGTDGFNRVAKVGDISANQITVASGNGIETDLKAGSVISNFYHEPTHPNNYGYKAVADFGVRSAFPIVPNQKHVLLGDSWFDTSESTGTTAFEDQLNSRLSGSTIINAGIGGNTLCDLINRFESDVESQIPQYVWINSSINDYFNDVSASDYKTRMQFLIGKVQALGATAIVYDSAPAVGTSFGGNDLTVLSNRYAFALLELFEEAQQ